MNIRIGPAILAGAVATAVMTAVGLWMAPLMGLPAMNPADMLAAAMGGMLMLGWLAHFMIGTILALVFAAVQGFLPGPPVVRGAVYSFAPFLVAQLMVMPMMGMPLFSGSAGIAAGSLFGHLIYGAVLGGIYGATASRHVRSSPAPALR